MNDVLRDLLLNGYMIYPIDGKFAVKKESVPANQNTISERLYENYEIALKAAEDMLNAPKKLKWAVIVRYNRGLGIEYKNLSDVCATTKEGAKTIATNLAQKTMLNDRIDILEVRVRLKI
jgi:hypothetical protein